MKTIGLLGGMSWESTAHYYAILNREIARRTGAAHSARVAMLSVDFAEFRGLMEQGDWDMLTRRLCEEAALVEAAGADCLVIATNTMHFAAERIAASVSIPLLHIADVTARAILAAGVPSVGLLGTAFTMEQPFYRERLESAGIGVLVPEPAERASLHRIIFEELVSGEVRPESRAALLAMIEPLRTRGAEGIVLGCTEIMLLIGQDDTDLAVFDTTTIHALAAVDFARG
jgi:aspartate racemase